MKELLDKFLMWFCFAGIGSIAVVAFVRVTLNKWKMKNVKCKIQKFILHSPFYILHFLIPILCVAGLIVYGSTKSNSPTNDPPAQQQMVMQPGQLVEQRFDKVASEVVEGSPVQKVGEVALQSVELVEPPASNALVRVEKWWRRGAYNDGQILTFDEDWCFPYGTNHLTRVEVWASGAVYPSMKNPTSIASLVTKLSLAPHDTEVFIGRTTNNTYRIEWHGGHPNRDASQTADASIELFKNGNVVVTENGVETLIPYDIPFEHDGFGQDEDWVRANFTNAEEILSVGYTNWVVQTVGVNEANGLFYLTATFDEDPPEPCHLSVGGSSVAVNEGGTYYFLLPVFEEHELHCWPYPELVRYEIDDGYTGEETSYRLSCSPGYSSRMMARSRTRTSSGSDDLHDGTFSVEPLVVTDPPRIPVRVAENATVSSFWNVSSVSSLTWTDQQGEVEFADATAPSTTISHVMQPTTLAVAMNDGTHEATGYVAIHGDDENSEEELSERYDAGSGVNDGAVEIASDLEVDDFSARWFAFSGRGTAGEDCRLTHDFEIPAGRTCYIGAFVGSQEYSEWTGRNSQYNDRIYWNIKTNRTANVYNLRKFVNELHGDFAEAAENEHSANGLDNAVHLGGVFLTAGTNSLPVTLTLAVFNVGDEKRESTGLFGVFPVSIIQSNYPRATGRYSSTDAGGVSTNGLIRAGGLAYITGEPAMAALTAKIRNLPDWIETAWSGNLTTERTERRTRDDRDLIATNVMGAVAYDITEALTNEVVGGRCVIQSRVDDCVTGTHEFFIRGKNPMDSMVRAYMAANIDLEFRSYAWKCAKHETIVGLNANSLGVITNAVCYNQFNPRGRYKELPDFGSPDGWGIGQIDRSGNEESEFNYTTTKEVYDWQESIDSMNSVLREKKNMYLEIVGWFRAQYQNDPNTNWVEPNVTTNVSGVVLNAREWSIMTLYNGSGGCPRLNIPGRPRNGSPIHFDPITSRWILYTNSNNYVPKVMAESNAEEVD